jgi:LPS export ABC transporter protein LptC
MIEFFMKKSFLVVLSLFLFALFLFIVKGEKGVRVDVRQKGESFIEGLKIVNKKNGVRDWVLTARRADLSENGEQARLADVELSMEKRGVTIYADSGLYNMSDKSVAIDGKIIAKGSTFAITSESVEYDSSTGDLKTDSPVTIEGSKFSVQGKGMNMNNTEQKVRILKDVKAIFYN